jgi:hypothetical protein
MSNNQNSPDFDPLERPIDTVKFNILIQIVENLLEAGIPNMVVDSGLSYFSCGPG